MAPEDSSSSSGITTDHQFEKALHTAESLLDQADHEQEKADRVLAGEIGTVAAAVAIASTIVALGFPAGAVGRAFVLIIGVAAGFVVAGAMHMTVRRQLVSQSRRDGQAAVYIVSLLREAVMIITDIEDWNETQVRLARARLSRFPTDEAAFPEE